MIEINRFGVGTILVYPHLLHFMIRWRDIVKDCQFKKPDEIVKFLFLTRNQNPKVREELFKSMKKGDGLNDILGYAHLVEGNQHSEHLSKVYLNSEKTLKQNC